MGSKNPTKNVQTTFDYQVKEQNIKHTKEFFKKILLPE